MKKNLSKILALILALVMVLTVFAGCKNTDEPAPSGATEATNGSEVEPTDAPPVEAHENKVIYGSGTEVSGDLGNAWWTNNATDKLIRDLIDDYSVIVYDQFGQMVVNNSVAESVADPVKNEDESATYTVKIKEGLTYNNGEPITAADYVAYALVAYSPAVMAAGGKVASDSVVGAAEYQNGEAKELAGIRLLDEYTYSITITPDYANYYFGLLNASLSPLYLPMYSSAELTVKDDGNGAYLDGGELTAEEVTASRYIYEDRVSAGPYQLKSLDTGSLITTVVRNPNYAGNFEGQKPSIETIVIVKAEDETMMDAFKTGEIDFLSQLSDGDQINAALDLVEEGGYDYCHYTRNGYGKLMFQCDFGPTQFVAVRQAIAYMLDRNEFANTFCDGFGSVVHGPYSTAQWMYQESEELFNEKLNTYAYNPAKAVELLEADGWTLNADGTEYSGTGLRYKEVTPEEAGDYALNVTLDDGRILMPLHIMWASSENNPVSDLLATMLANGQQTADAGMEIEQNIMTFSELLNWMYRDTSVGDQYGVRTYGMYNLGTGFNQIYDYSYNFASDPDSIYVEMGYNTNYIFDKELDDLSMDMVYKAAPGDDAAYLDYYQKFVIRFNELLPDLALYCNDYHTIFPSWLKNYNEGSMWDFQSAILYAYVEGAE
ncbi:MAG: ABC transporter substrate-binding protein [Oscillospiraceae bacterium]|nr:ABC transporter substrate-binding protein [Oscillospiraceae bacterium]